MQTSLIISVVVFLVFLIALERLHSIKIIIRLAISLALIYGYIMAISEGKSMILFSMLLVALLTITNAIIKEGFHKKTFTEIISVLFTTTITSHILFLICKKANLNIYHGEIQSFNGIKRPENAVACIFMITTLGIYMDIISRIIFRLDEKKNKTQDVPWKDQFKEGMEIGRLAVREKANSLLILGLGIGILPICVYLHKGTKFFDIFLKDEMFFSTFFLIMACIGTFISAISAAVFYAWFNRKKEVYKTTSENMLDGKRSLKI